MKFPAIRSTRALARYSLAFAIALIAPVAALAQNANASSGTAGGAPRTAVDLKPGTASYKWRLERAGRVITMDMTRTVKEQNGAWLVTETTKIPEATITDEAILEKRTLVLRKRVVVRRMRSRRCRFRMRTPPAFATSMSRLSR